MNIQGYLYGRFADRKSIFCSVSSRFRNVLSAFDSRSPSQQSSTTYVLLQLAASKLQKEGGSQKNTKSAPPPPLGFAVGVAAECSCSVSIMPAAAQ